MEIFTPRNAVQRSCWARYLLLCLTVLASVLPTAVWAQAPCSCTTTLGEMENATPAAGTTVCIASGTTYTGRLTISNNNVTICNSGTLRGIIEITGNNTVINNNANSVVASDYVPISNSSAGLQVMNAGTWNSALTSASNLTITNSGTWDGYMGADGAISITNTGAWTGQVLGTTADAIVTIAHKGGTWTGRLDGAGQGSLIITNTATWTQGFNFPSGTRNAFTTALGATSSFNTLGINGVVALVNNGTMNVNSADLALTSGSTLRNAASSTFQLTGNLTNNGTIANSGAIAVSGNFTNSGTVTGAAALPRSTITATSYTTNSGSLATDGTYLDFCDSTPPMRASNGFDAPGGTVGSNVTYCGMTPAPLPVTLTSFTAQLRQGQVQVQWATASEVNNQEFVVERSADGQRFNTVQVVAGYGTTARSSGYAVTDAEPLPGLSYYRLRQVDFGGASTYSPVVSIRNAAAAALPLLYPNPTTDGLTLDLSAQPAGPCEVRVLDVLGKLVLRQALAAGQAQVLSLGRLPAGTYLLHLSSPTQGHSVQRIIKQ